MRSPEAKPASPPAPVIPQHQNYGDAAYWDERYGREPVCFDWYQGYEGLAPLLLRHLPRDEPLLHVGAGTSRLQEGLARSAGYKRVVNVDVSRAAVDMMQALHAGVAGLEYRVADVRSMPEFADASFGSVLDKGTLDALLCGSGARAAAAAALGECCRLLRPGGVFMLVTYGDPDSRLPHLVTPELAWDVVAYALAKPPPADMVPGSSGAGGSGEGGGGSGKTTAAAAAAAVAQGPYDASQPDQMAALTAAAKDAHFVYVATKRGGG